MQLVTLVQIARIFARLTNFNLMPNNYNHVILSIIGHLKVVKWMFPWVTALSVLLNRAVPIPMH